MRRALSVWRSGSSMKCVWLVSLVVAFVYFSFSASLSVNLPYILWMIFSLFGLLREAHLLKLGLVD